VRSHVYVSLFGNVSPFDPKIQKITERCLRCDKERTRPMTKKEYDDILKKAKKEDSLTKQMNSTGWDFAERFYKDGKWKYKGYSLMEKVRKWAKNHPEVKIVGCDDSIFAGSIVVLIPHTSEKEMWGVLVVNIPQCTGEDPVEMWYYPRHLQRMMIALMEIHKEWLDRSDL